MSDNKHITPGALPHTLKIRRLLNVVSLIIPAFFSFLSGQKYNFVNWTVEDGLIQSQASYLYQDAQRQLWIGTEGGVCRFDGKKFTGYTVQEGLVTNHVSMMHGDHSGRLWIASNYGVTVFNGRTFRHIKPGKGPMNNVTAMCNTTDSSVLLLNNFGAYRVKDMQPEKILFSGDTAEKVTTISAQKNGDVLAFVFRKGLYVLTSERKTRKIYEIPEELKRSFVGGLFISAKKDTLLLINSGLYRLVKNILTPYTFSNGNGKGINFSCLAEDSKGHLWMGSDNGAYKEENGNLVHFTARSGLTDNTVSHILMDAENNLWFATDGDGIFKFRENTFTYFDKSSGLENPIIMGVAQTSDGTIYAGGYGGGLYKIKNGTLDAADYRGPVLADSRIYCLYTDEKDNLLIGTISKGIWRFNEKTGLSKIEAATGKQTMPRGATCLIKDKRGNLVTGSGQGLFVMNEKGEVFKSKTGGSGIVTTVVNFGDSLLVGTSNGLFFLDANYNVKSVNNKLLENSYILCFARQGNNIWIGTTDKGVLNWNFKTGQILHYTTAKGLPSNFIYSIYISEDKKAWIGTGFGISNLQFNNQHEVTAIKNYGRSDGLLGMECSHNCLLRAKDSSLWFGTTKGLFHFNPYTSIAGKNPPFVSLKSVKLFSSSISDSTLFKSKDTWQDVPRGLVLGPRQNHITFELGSVFLTNPDDVIYKYRLEGIEKGFNTTSNPIIIYPALPPGKYTLRVGAFTKNGPASQNTVEFSFEIEKAFYQTRIFQTVVAISLLLTGGLIAYLITRSRQKRKQKAKELLEKIREEEFTKLRQRTAEDFHDEMGNRLTRISVLSDILKSKLNGQSGDTNHLVHQIKENTNALYHGSRDIIWSLNSQNDGIYEITEHLKSIGTEMFSETHVNFDYRHNIVPDTGLKMKLDYSRNLIMIFKEAYSNILKYSSAEKVWILFEMNPMHQLNISIHDNGQGFDNETQKEGNGLKNIENRVKRMNGELKIKSEIQKGTVIEIKLNI